VISALLEGLFSEMICHSRQSADAHDVIIINVLKVVERTYETVLNVIVSQENNLERTYKKYTF
jgi:hypothetical protein